MARWEVNPRVPEQEEACMRDPHTEVCLVACLMGKANPGKKRWDG